MVGKKILLNDMAEKVAGGTLKYFEVMWKKKRQKKRKKQGKKRLNLVFTLDISPLVIP